MSDAHEISKKLSKELKNGLQILFKLKNDKVDYSITNRPEPNLSGVTDQALATAIVFAGSNFPIKRVPVPEETEKVSRSDGRTLAYKESVDIDWEKRSIKSTRGRELTLKILSVVVQNLAKRDVPFQASN